MKHISIIGAGWLGLPLALQLQKTGYKLHCSTTNTTKAELLADLDLNPVVLKISEDTLEQTGQPMFQSETLVITLPFKRSFEDPSLYLKQIKNIIDACNAEKLRHLLFTSSTSIYPEENSVVTETSPINSPNQRQKTLKEVEDYLLLNKTFKTTVLRFGGLYGVDRKLTNFMKKSQPIKNGHCPVNLIHQKDAVNIMKHIIEKHLWGNVFNAVSDKHPSRKELYSTHAERDNIPLPIFENDESIAYKIVSNEKLKQHLDYNFIYPDPLSDYE